VDALGFGELGDSRLVLSGHDRATVGEREPGCSRIAVGRDHVHVGVARGFEQPELRRAGA